VASISGTTVKFTGTITHAYGSMGLTPGFVIFLSNSADVSSSKHLTSLSTYTSKPSGSTIEYSIGIDKNLFPSGSTLYAVVYGRSAYYTAVLNPETLLYEYGGLSETPSNVGSVNIP
jgi:hypothetical protein